MIRLLLFFLVLLPAISFSQQHQVSIYIMGNVPWIPAVTHEEILWNVPISGDGPASPFIGKSIREVFEPKVGYTFGAQVSFSLTDIFCLSTGLTLNYLRFNRSLHNSSPSILIIINPDVIPSGDTDFDGSIQTVGYNPWIPITKMTTNPQKNYALYSQIPIIISSRFLKGKLQVGLGPTISLLAKAVQYNKKYSLRTGAMEYYKQDTQEDLMNFQFGAALQVKYLIKKNIDLVLNSETALTPSLASKLDSNRNARINTFALGLSYTLSGQSNSQ